MPVQNGRTGDRKSCSALNLSTFDKISCRNLLDMPQLEQLLILIILKAKVFLEVGRVQHVFATQESQIIASLVNFKP